MQVAKLAVHQDDADILLNEKNALDQKNIDKYRTAGIIAQTTLKYLIQLINDSYHLHKTERPYSVQELCILGDSMMVKLLNNVYNNTDKVREKGISHPVTIEVNEFVSNYSPELDAAEQQLFQAGDIVTLSLGAHIDGYTAFSSHTLVIYPPGVIIDDELKPEGPLLGSKADAIVACSIATRAVIAFLGLAVHPEMMPWIPELQNVNAVTGSVLRQLVDSIAESFGCVVVPGSKIRRVRRFLSGQAEGVVAERDFKGVVWDESNQEEALLKKSTGTDLIVRDEKTAASTNASSAIPTDDFVVTAGEVYNVDLRMCATADFAEKGLVTLADVEDVRPTIYVRDVAITHHLRLKSARQLLGYVDKHCSVYPFKLSHTTDSFPVDYESSDFAAQLNSIKTEIRARKLGLNELANRYLARAKPVQIVKHIPYSKILTASNPTGKHGIDAAKLALPGKEIPLPALGISALKLKALLKFGAPASATARESTTVMLNNVDKEVIRLTGGNKTARPSWVHSRHTLKPEVAGLVGSLNKLLDETNNYKVKEVLPLKLNSQVLHLEETMQLD